MIYYDNIVTIVILYISPGENRRGIFSLKTRIFFALRRSRLRSGWSPKHLKLYR